MACGDVIQRGGRIRRYQVGFFQADAGSRSSQNQQAGDPFQGISFHEVNFFSDALVWHGAAARRGHGSAVGIKKEARPVNEGASFFTSVLEAGLEPAQPLLAKGF